MSVALAAISAKHWDWNVVGPSFIGVHEMIDPQVEVVRAFADDVAERIAALGASPQGTPGAIIKDRDWDDYSVGRDTVQAHLAALDLVYTGVIEDLRSAIDETDDLDPVTQDLLIGRQGHWRSSSGSSGRIWRAPWGSWPIRARPPKRVPRGARGASRSRLLVGRCFSGAFGLGGRTVEPLCLIDGDVGARHQQRCDPDGEDRAGHHRE